MASSLDSGWLWHSCSSYSSAEVNLFGVDEIVGAFVKIWEAKKFGEHLRLVMSVFFTYWLGGSFAAGTALLSTKSYLIAAATFLITGSVLGYGVLRRSPLTKGMQFAAPAGEALKEMDTPSELTTRT